MASNALAKLQTKMSTAASAARNSKKLQKLEERSKSIMRRAKEQAYEAEEALITIGTPAVVGLLEANGTKLPTFGGFDPMLVWGAPLALLAPKIIGGRWGMRFSAAGVGMCSVAANNAAKKGTFKVAGDEDEIGADDDEIGADDDDD